MTPEELTDVIAKGGAWAPHPPTRSSDKAIEGLGAAMALSAIHIKVGTAGTATDRARLVAGELELFGYYIAPVESS
jgi:hypothetical protein